MMPFERSGDVIVAAFAAQEVEVLRELVEQEIGLLTDLAATGESAGEPSDPTGIGGSSAASDDPALARLFPDAYRDDADAASEYRRLTERSIAERKVAAARALHETLGDGAVQLRLPEAELWLKALTDLRLIIAVRLGIERTGDEGRDDEVMQDIYQWLGYVQGSILDALED